MRMNVSRLFVTARAPCERRGSRRFRSDQGDHHVTLLLVLAMNAAQTDKLGNTQTHFNIGSQSTGTGARDQS
jgi:hypothetical protein